MRIGRIEAIEKEAGKAFGIEVKDLHVDGHGVGLAKTIAIELSCRLTGKTQREVGQYFGYTSDSSVVGLGKRITCMKGRLLKTYSTSGPYDRPENDSGDVFRSDMLEESRLLSSASGAQ